MGKKNRAKPQIISAPVDSSDNPWAPLRSIYNSPAPREEPPKNRAAAPTESDATHAAYNFVPFAPNVIVRYEDPAQLPRHDRQVPELLSGEIRLTLTAQTDVIVGSSSDGSFRQDSQGNYIISGSTLRGLIRENMQILGCGAVRPGQDYEDIRILYRDIMGKNQRADTYRKVLGVQSETQSNGSARIGTRNVRAGYLHCRGSRYEIHPADYLRISKDDPCVRKWRNSLSVRVPVWYRLDSTGRPELRDENPGQDFRPGILLAPGHTINQNSVYLFLEENAGQHPIQLTEEEIFSYKADLHMKENGLKGTDKSHPMDPDFWKLPASGESRAVFYVTDNGFTSFGVSRYLRVGYKNKLSDGVRQTNADQLLDYPNAILGFAEKDGSYRSRVSVGNLKSVGKVTPRDPAALILAEPKPSFYAAYLMPNGQTAMDYNYSDLKLRGFKQYWFKNTPLPEAAAGNMATDIQAMPAGTAFTGTIRFCNLHEDELGLLLWCLRLDKNCFQPLGKGKPYGLGRFSVELNAVTLDDLRERCSSFAFTPASSEDTDAAVNRRIVTYMKYAQAALERSTGRPVQLRAEPHIQDFLFLRKKVFDGDTVNVSDMGLNKSKGRTAPAPLPTVEEFRKRQR